MSTEYPPIEVLCPESYQRLVRLLDAVVQSRPDLRSTCTTLVRPLRILRELGTACTGALAQEPWTAERFRLVLLSARSAGIPLLDAERGLCLDSEATNPPAPPPGLLHLGRMAAVGFAAIRCNLPIEAEDWPLETLLGLSLGLGPAEALLRMGEASEATEELVHSFADAISSSEKGESALIAMLRLLGSDRAERARQQALDALFHGLFVEAASLRGQSGLESGKPTWLGMEPPIFIRSAQPAAPRPGTALKLELLRAALALGKLRLLFVNPARPAEGVWVDLALPDPETVPADAEIVDLNGVVPPEAEPGWCGLIAIERIADSNAAREELWKRWTVSERPYLELTPLTPDLLPPLGTGDRAGLAPLPCSQPFEGGLPTLTEVTVRTPTLDEQGHLQAKQGEIIQISWSTRAAHGVLIDLAGVITEDARPAGSASREAPAPPADGKPWKLLLTPFADPTDGERLRGRVVEHEIQPQVEPPPAKPDPAVPTTDDIAALRQNLSALVATQLRGSLLSQITALGGSTGMASSALLSLSGSLGSYGLPSGATAIALPPAFPSEYSPGIRVVLIQPAYVDETDGESEEGGTGSGPTEFGAMGSPTGGSGESATFNAAAEIETLLGPLEPTILHLPWVSDELAVTTESMEGNDDPATHSFLDALAAQAARTPGLEDALWIAVVPGSEVAVVTICEAARVLAVVSPDSLHRTLALLAEALPEFPLATKVPRIRITGRLYSGDRLALDPLRLESRAAGGGGAGATGLEAVALDRTGRELSRRALTAVTSTLPATVTALLPVPARVSAVEIRQGARVLRRVEARGSSEDLGVSNQVFHADGGVVTWTCSATASATHVWIELGVPSERGGPPLAWVPFGASAAKDGTVSFHRLSALGWCGARLVASDGWASAVLVFDAGSPPEQTLAIRAIEGGNFAVIWTASGATPPVAVTPTSWDFKPDPGEAMLGGGGPPFGPTIPLLYPVPLGVAGVLSALFGGMLAVRPVGRPPAVPPIADRLPIVLIRPFVVTPGDPPTFARVGGAGALGVLTAACATGGLVPALVELPWLPDELAVMTPAEGPGGGSPRKGEDQLLAAATFALLSQGLEGLPWIVLLPDGGEAPWASSDPTTGALRVLVSTCGALESAMNPVITAWSAYVPPAVTTGMVLAGRIPGGKRLVLDYANSSRRAPGPGEQQDLHVEAVCLDSGDAPLASSGLRGIRADDPSWFNAFLPLPPATMAIELRRDQDTLRRLVSPVGPPTTGTPTCEGNAVTVQVTHPGHVPCKVWLEALVKFPPELAERPPAWVRCYILACAAQGTTPGDPLQVNPQRLEAHGGLRLAVSDDWNVTCVAVKMGDKDPSQVCAIRPVGNDQWVLVRDGQIADDVHWVFKQSGGGTEEAPVTVIKTSGSGVLEAHTDSTTGPLLDTRTVGAEPSDMPPCGGVAEQFAYVLLRPVVIGCHPAQQVTAEEVVDALGKTEPTTGLQPVSAGELAWVEDPLAVLETTPWGERDPQVPLILERMAVRATRTIGADNALWLMVVPGDVPWFESRRAHGAAALAITTLAGLPDLMKKLARQLRAQVTRSQDEPHVRFVGWVDDQALLHMKDLRCEMRRRATDLPESSGVTMALVTAESNTVVEVPVDAGRQAVPTWLTALVPTSEDVTRVMLGQHGRIIGIAQSVLGTPSFVQPPTLDAVGMLRWRFRHTSAVEPHLFLEAGAANLRTPVGEVPACPGGHPAGLYRFRRADTLVLTACDGWNEAHAQVVPATPRGADDTDAEDTDGVSRAAIRTDGRGDWWCDTGLELDDLQAVVTWDLSKVQAHGQPADAVQDRHLVLPAAAEGRLTVHVWEKDDVPLLTQTFDGIERPAQPRPIDQWVRAVALSWDHAHLAAAMVDDRVRCGPADGVLGELWSSTASVRALAVPGGGASVYVGLGTGEVRHVGTFSGEIGWHGAAVHSMALERHGGWLVTGGEDGQVWAWSLDGRDPILVDQRSAGATAVAVKLAQQVPPDGSAARPVLLVVTGWSDGAVRVHALDFTVAEPMEQQAPVLVGCHPGAIRTVDIGRGEDGLLADPRNLRLLSACEEGEVRAWWLKSRSLCSGGTVLSWRGLGLALPTDHTGTLRFEGDAQVLITDSATAREGRWETKEGLGWRILRWRASRTHAPTHLPVLESHTDEVTAWANHPVTNETLAGTRSGQVLLVDHEQTRLFGVLGAPIRAAAFDPAGDWAATADEDGKVLLWKLRYQHGPIPVTHQAGAGAALALLEVDGKVVVVSGGSDGKLRVFAIDPENPEPGDWPFSEEIGYHARPVTGVAVALAPEPSPPPPGVDAPPPLSPAWAGRLRIASSAAGEPERLWRPVEGEPSQLWESAALDCPDVAAASARFNHEGTRVAIATARGRVALWLLGYDGEGLEASLVGQQDHRWPALDVHFLDRSYQLLVVLGTRSDTREIGETDPDALD